MWRGRRIEGDAFSIYRDSQNAKDTLTCVFQNLTMVFGAIPVYDFGSKGAAFFSGVNGDKMPPS